MYFRLLWGGVDDNEIARRGWFTPPFDTVETLKQRLEPYYDIVDFHVVGAMVYFRAIKTK